MTQNEAAKGKRKKERSSRSMSQVEKGATRMWQKKNYKVAIEPMMMQVKFCMRDNGRVCMPKGGGG